MACCIGGLEIVSVCIFAVRRTCGNCCGDTRKLSAFFNRIALRARTLKAEGLRNGRRRRGSDVVFRWDDDIQRAWTSKEVESRERGCQARIRRCRIHTILGSNRSGCRLRSSSNSVVSNSPGSDLISGTISSFQTPASGSARVRQARASRCDGNAVACSIRGAEGTKITVFAAAISYVAHFLISLYLRTW